ncbi:MAG: glutaredoxin family protein [Candidatus Saccharibacteria bacterium]|nr:glutaredoxin family protein [Candidatus Saccharibacteria bacterium]
MEKVIVYSTATCPYCHALTDWLDQLNVTYQVVDASTQPDIQAVPVTKIGDQKIIGFDRPNILEALKRIKAI